MSQDDPIHRAAEAARKMVEQSAVVAKAESTKIDAATDAKPYEVTEAITAATKLTNIGIAGAVDIGRIAAEQKPPDTVLAMGEYIAWVVRRMVSRSGTVAAAASIEVEKKSYTPNKWLESWIRLTDIGIEGGMEIIETVAAGPARFQSQPVRFDGLTMPAAANSEPRTLSASLARDATGTSIDAKKITFEPPTLVDPNTTFAMIVDTSGLVSGVYEGQISASYPGTNPPPDTLDIAIPV